MAEITFHKGLLNMTPAFQAPDYFETYNEIQPYRIPSGAASNPGSYVRSNAVYLNVDAPDYPAGTMLTLSNVFQWTVWWQDFVDAQVDTGAVPVFCIKGTYVNNGEIADCYLHGGFYISSHITTGQNTWSGNFIVMLSSVDNFTTSYNDNTKILNNFKWQSNPIELSSLTLASRKERVKLGLTFLRLKYDANGDPLEYETDFLNYGILIAIANPANNDSDASSKDMAFNKNSSGALTSPDYKHTVLMIHDLLMFTQWQTIFTIEEYSNEVGEPSMPGGYGGGSHAFDRSSDSISGPIQPSVGILGTGFVHAYAPSMSDLSGIGTELLPQLTFNPPAPITAGASVMETLADMFDSAATWLANIPSIIENSQRARMIDYVLDCHLIPVTPTKGSTQPIRVGWQSLTNQAPVVTSDYVYYYMGTLNLYEFYENFADYLGRARMFIPFVGFVTCQPEWFNNTALTLEYMFNIIDGSFTAYLTGAPISDKHRHLLSSAVLGQWGGSCCVHIPITGINYANMMSGAIGGAAGAVMAAGSGNLAGAATSAINAISARGTVEQSNSYSASAAFLGGREAYIMMERPVSSWSKSYAHEIGIPANITTKLGSISGFAKVENIHLDGIDATDAEKAEIERLLREGVIL